MKNLIWASDNMLPYIVKKQYDSLTNNELINTCDARGIILSIYTRNTLRSKRMVENDTRGEEARRFAIDKLYASDNNLLLMKTLLISALTLTVAMVTLTLTIIAWNK